MAERQGFGVQRLASESAQGFGDVIIGTGRQSQTPAVDRIAHDRAPDMGQVDADLMGPARLQRAP